MFPPVLRVDRDEQVAQERRVRLTLFGRVPAPELDAADALGERNFLPAPERPDRREDRVRDPFLLGHLLRGRHRSGGRTTRSKRRRA